MSAPVNLSTIAAGTGGFVIYGQDAEDQSGWSIASAGDVNGDGFDDILIGARFAAAAGNAKVQAGDSYLVFGKASGFAAVDLATVAAGSGGFVIHGQDGGDRSGTSVSSAGDVNGDGFADLLIGAPYGDAATNGKLNAGESYVLFGKASGFAASVDLTAVAGGGGGFVIHGQDFFDYSGWSVAGAGDINGDGFDDLLIGARGGDASGNSKSLAGDIYVVFGKASGFGASVDLSAVAAGIGGFVIHGQDANDQAGWSVASAGDVNGDGFDDLLIGTRAGDAALNESSNAGDTYVVFGKASGFTASIDLASVAAGIGGFVIWGIDNFDYSGTSVSSAGDINGDGFDDLVIGAYRADASGNGKYNAGDAYVVFGKSTSFGASVNLATVAAGSGGFVIFGQRSEDEAAFSVASAGDVNGDGFDDLLIGAHYGDGASGVLTNAGNSYVIFGKANGFGASIDLTTIAAGTGGFVIYGEDSPDNAGSAVSAGGDINGDGFDDLLIGARQADAAGNAKNDAGDSYVIFGKAFDVTVTHPGTTDADNLTGTAGADIMIGGLGNDTLSGAQGNDVLRGGAGNDSLTGGAGADRINGGNGRDTASYTASPAGVSVNLLKNLNTGGDAQGDLLSDIENVTGSAFNDTLTGDALANVFTGGQGNDTITGGAGVDTAIFSGLKSSYTITKAAGTVTVSGTDGVDLLTGVEKLSFDDAIINLAKLISGDFNADGISDLMWRNTSSGANAIWQSAQAQQTQGVTGVGDPSNWKLVGNWDFSGDGIADMLWRNASSGANALWLAGQSAQTQGVSSVGDLNWKVAGIGDFDGDARADILWRNISTGSNVIWKSADSATAQAVDSVGDQSWKIAGIGDFDGDGKSDILWRNFTSGADVIWKSANSATAQAVSGVSDQAWKVAGIGDFNADGQDDILWRNASTGVNAIWNAGNSSTGLAVDWVTDLNYQVAAVGDYNGDGKADIAWRNSSTGASVIWNAGNSATPITLVGVADNTWTNPAQTGTWVDAAGGYVV